MTTHETKAGVHISSKLKLIVGLGNPGKVYEYSRHNLGFIAVKSLALDLGCSFKKNEKFRSFIAKSDIGGLRVLLALPLTFMNLSGHAVKSIKVKNSIDIADIIVVCDDVSLNFGSIMIKPKGSSAGHNGLKSIISELGSDQFCRLKIGIKRDNVIADMSEYVLASFTKDEKSKLSDITSRALDCLKVWVNEGSEKAMSVFNRK